MTTRHAAAPSSIDLPARVRRASTLCLLAGVAATCTMAWAGDENPAPTLQWFECPCHGSSYNRVGEKKAGPAPRGMDRFGVSVNNGVLVIDTGSVFGGPPIGTNTTGQEAEGPHCVGAGSH